MYHLRGRLFPELGRLDGAGRIEVENTSPYSWSEFVLRLDQNRFVEPTEGLPTTHGMSLTELSVNGESASLPGPRVVGLNSTVVRVSLDSDLGPGAVLQIELRWTYEIPEDESGLALRQGRWGTSVYQMGQWYPRLAMFDDLGGWDLAVHSGSMEFYNPFSSFRVTLVVPPTWLLGATGRLVNENEVLPALALGRLREARVSDTTVVIMRPEEWPLEAESEADREWRFEADSVRDFAWGASPVYTWFAVSRRAGDRRLLVNALSTARHREALREGTVHMVEALTALSGVLGPYPWEVHWLIDGPEGGMEYPGLTMSHGDDRIPHEAVHQWFPMVVGSDETRFSFLDEGLASFLAGVPKGDPLGQAPREHAAVTPLLLPDDVRTVRPVLGYGRGSRMLSALSLRFGDAAVLQALREYAEAWRFKHPSPWDFMASLEASLGSDLRTFWLMWLFSTDAIGP